MSLSFVGVLEICCRVLAESFKWRCLSLSNRMECFIVSVLISSCWCCIGVAVEQRGLNLWKNLRVEGVDLMNGYLEEWERMLGMRFVVNE